MCDLASWLVGTIAVHAGVQLGPRAEGGHHLQCPQLLLPLWQPGCHLGGRRAAELYLVRSAPHLLSCCCLWSCELLLCRPSPLTLPHHVCALMCVCLDALSFQPAVRLRPSSWRATRHPPHARLLQYAGGDPLPMTPTSTFLCPRCDALAAPHACLTSILVARLLHVCLTSILVALVVVGTV